MLLLPLVASAQERFLFVNEASGITNGPFVISPHGSITLEDSSYTLRPVTMPFEFESHIVPEIDVTNAEPRDVLSHALTTCGMTNNHSGRVVIFLPHTVTGTVTLSARELTLRDTIAITADMCDLSTVRDHRAKVVILVPNDIADGRTARVYRISPAAYETLVYPSDSVSQLLFHFGVVRREEHVIADYQRGKSVLILYASATILNEFEATFSPWFPNNESGQHPAGP